MIGRGKRSMEAFKDMTRDNFEGYSRTLVSVKRGAGRVCTAARVTLRCEGLGASDSAAQFHRPRMDSQVEASLVPFNCMSF
jgi:hypothetical protein